MWCTAAEWAPSFWATVVVPENAEDQVTPLEDGIDLPDRVDDQLRWLEDAQLDPTFVWAERDLVVIRAVKLLRAVVARLHGRKH